MADVTRPLDAAQHGEPQAVADLFPFVYDALRAIVAAKMAAEAPGHTLVATALVHEACVKLNGHPRRHHTGRLAIRMLLQARPVDPTTGRVTAPPR